MGCCCCMALFPVIERFSSNKCVLHEITLLSWVLGWWLTGFLVRDIMGSHVSFSSRKGPSCSWDTMAGAFSLHAQCGAGLDASCWHSSWEGPSGGPVSLFQPSLRFEARLLCSCVSGCCFQEVGWKQWCPGLWWKSQFVWMSSFLELVSCVPIAKKFATPWALIGMLLSSQIVNRYICSSLFRFLLQFVIH